MRLVRFTSGNSTSFGVLEGEQIRQLAGDPYSEIKESGESFALADVKLLAPVEPKKIVLVGLNFASHAAEIHQETPSEPLIFFKPPSAMPRRMLAITFSATRSPTMSPREISSSRTCSGLGAKPLTASARSAHGLRPILCPITSESAQP